MAKFPQICVINFGDHQLTAFDEISFAYSGIILLLDGITSQNWVTFMAPCPMQNKIQLVGDSKTLFWIPSIESVEFVHCSSYQRKCHYHRKQGRDIVRPDVGSDEHSFEELFWFHFWFWCFIYVERMKCQSFSTLDNISMSSWKTLATFGNSRFAGRLRVE